MISIEDVFDCHACNTVAEREASPSCVRRGARERCGCYGRECPGCGSCEDFGPICGSPEELKHAEETLGKKIVR